MPYSSLDDANPAIKGIDPPVTLSQANTIAAMADAIEEEGEADNPWAVAIAQFKKAYEVDDGKWVKRERSMNPVRQLWNQIKAAFEPHLEEERAVGLGQLFNQLDLALYESSDHGTAWLHDLYRDDDGSLFAIASERGKLYRVGLEFAEDGATLGEWVPVAEEFKPVGEARTRTNIIRQANGRVRWLSVSCTSVLNRVGEIDSQALFDSFVEHARDTGEYPYRTFYHQGEALKTGQADYMARDGSVFITSGLYDDDNPLAAAEIVAREKDPERWGESINYVPTSPPELVEIAEGVAVPVYASGIMRETSTLPTDKAAAWFTATRDQEVRRMRQDVMDALLELLDGDEERAAEFAKLVDGTNREITDAGLVSREADPGEGGVGVQPATETPAEPQEPPEIAREVNLDEAAVALIAAQFAAMLAPFQEKLEALEKAIGGTVDTQVQAVDEARQAREALDTRLKAMERDDEDKQRQWLADMPRRETLTVTHRPREANRPDGDDEPAQPNPSAVLDAAGVPAY
ncbi:MAG TPA: hypothetical protein VMY40_12980 [Anaerolineae bacterium]|nr:hypothetical protein [Anaerolineae bacterium]